MRDHPPRIDYLPGTKTVAGLSLNAKGLRYYLELDQGVCAGTVGNGEQHSGAICGIWESVPPRRMEEREIKMLGDAVLARLKEDPVLEKELRAHPAFTRFLKIKLP